MYLPVTTHALWEWFMLLIVFARIRYIIFDIAWVVRLYYYGFLANDGIGLILVIQKFQLSTLSELYTLREESNQTNVILQYTLLASILSAVCSVIQQP